MTINLVLGNSGINIILLNTALIGWILFLNTSPISIEAFAGSGNKGSLKYEILVSELVS